MSLKSRTKTLGKKFKAQKKLLKAKTNQPT